MTNPRDVKPQEPATPTYNIEFRILLMTQWFTKGKNDWKQLEEATGIKAVKWRHVQAGVTRPSLDMFEALCKLFPHHAFWLATGIADDNAGHTAPQVNLAFPGGFGTFLATETPYTGDYYRACIAALDTVTRSLINAINRTKEDNRHQAPYQGTLQKTDLVSLFRIGINVSLQLSATEVRAALTPDKYRELTERLITARWHHIEAMMDRLREMNGVDDLIDQQRTQEQEFQQKFYKDEG
jgi:hypothetical protein